jgi:DNA modification methylase
MNTINDIIQGDCIEVMQGMDSESIDCIVTSPPYWGLRDYDAEGQIGLEPTLEEYHNKLLILTAECKRVLKKAGTMFWVHGDSYASSGGASRHNGYSDPKYSNGRTGKFVEPSAYPQGNIRPKSLFMQNYGLAMRMIDEQGWILRNILIWHKKNHMPSSVRDRYANAYEPVFFFSKSKTYHFDLDAIRIPQKEESKKKIVVAKKQKNCNSIKNKEMDKFNPIYRSTRDICENLDPEKGKNPGDVFTLPTQPFPEAHFAVFPEKLIEPFIKAGCPEGGIVLDPFMGAGTTAVVAKKLGRLYKGIEINSEYIKIAHKRISKIPVRLDSFI